jgi:cell division protein FtsA
MHAMRVLTSPADTGAVTLALPQDVQVEAADFPAELFRTRVWRIPRQRPDAALVRQGSVEGTRMFALGGRAFSKSLADRIGVDFDEAERLKLAHAAGDNFDEAEDVAAIIAEDVAVWAAGVELVLEEFGKEGLLPGRIELCGGGSALPDIRAALEAEDFAVGLPFARPPRISLIEPDAVENVIDQTGLLVDPRDVTPMALAYQALEASMPREPLDAALERVLRGMRV